MKKLQKVLVVAVLLICAGPATGGNPDRAGEAGAYELLMNGWARSTGLYALNSASIKGIEAMRVNPAGLAFTKKTEIVFSRTQWMQGTDIGINSVGFAQKFGKDKGNVLGIDINALSFGEIIRTTTSNPEGGLGTYSPTFFNIGLGYSRAFSNSIYAGFTVRLINERIDDLASTGFALSAGLQYVTGPRDNIHFGIAIKNVGTPMQFGGDGLAFRADNPANDDFELIVDQRAENFELPSQLNIGIGYDFYLDNAAEKPDHRLSVVAQFISNSFGKDQFGGGLEYAWREMFMVRAGYRYEDGITQLETRTSVHTGLAAGLTIEVPVKEGGPAIGFDYSFRSTSPFSGTHSFGVRVNL